MIAFLIIVLIKGEEICTQYSGVNNEGKNVMGILKYKPKNKRFEVDNVLKWYVNSEWTLQEAHKIPLAYSMVNVYLLYSVAHLEVWGLFTNFFKEDYTRGHQYIKKKCFLGRSLQFLPPKCATVCFINLLKHM